MQETTVAFCLGCSSGGGLETERVYDSRSCGDKTGVKSVYGKFCIRPTKEIVYSVTQDGIMNAESQPKSIATRGWPISTVKPRHG